MKRDRADGKLPVDGSAPPAATTLSAVGRHTGPAAQAHRHPRFPEGAPHDEVLGSSLDAEEFRGTERFEILGRLGQGGIGVVYRAFDRERQAEVALKTLRYANPDTIHRLKNEFRSLASDVFPQWSPAFQVFESSTPRSFLSVRSKALGGSSSSSGLEMAFAKAGPVMLMGSTASSGLL